MHRCAQNVIPLHPRGRECDDLPVPLERLSAAVRELDDLSDYIERITSDTQWLAVDWRATWTPLMLRLPPMRRTLSDLANVRGGQWPDANWAVRFRAALVEVEHRLLSVSMTIGSVVQGEAGSMDAMISLRFDWPELAQAAEQLCRLIVSRYPETLNRN